MATQGGSGPATGRYSVTEENPRETHPHGRAARGWRAVSGRAQRRQWGVSCSGGGSRRKDRRRHLWCAGPCPCGLPGGASPVCSSLSPQGLEECLLRPPSKKSTWPFPDLAMQRSRVPINWLIEFKLSPMLTVIPNAQSAPISQKTLGPSPRGAVPFPCFPGTRPPPPTATLPSPPRSPLPCAGPAGTRLRLSRPICLLPQSPV